MLHSFCYTSQEPLREEVAPSRFVQVQVLVRVFQCDVKTAF